MWLGWLDVVWFLFDGLVVVLGCGLRVLCSVWGCYNIVFGLFGLGWVVICGFGWVWSAWVGLRVIVVGFVAGCFGWFAFGI